MQEVTPSHRVTLTRPFYIQRGQVNQDHYRRVTGSVPAGNEGEKGFLMRNVALLDAVGFCNELSKLENRTPAYLIKDGRADWDRDSVGYRLPTEAEWEFAARAGTTAPWVFDYRGLTYDEFKNAVQQYMTRHRGAKAKANAFGLIDFYGGSDDRCFDRGCNYTRNAVTDPFENPGKSQGIARGSWFSEAGWEPSINNSVTRNRVREDNLRFTGLGRVVLSIPLPSPTKVGDESSDDGKPVLQLDGDDVLKDSAGNGHHGKIPGAKRVRGGELSNSVSGNPGVRTQGLGGYALQFKSPDENQDNKSSGWVEVPSLQDQDSSLTIEVWVSSPSRWGKLVPPFGHILGFNPKNRINGGRKGNWLTYGLGSVSENLPAFVAMTDPKGIPVEGVLN